MLRSWIRLSSVAICLCAAVAPAQPFDWQEAPLGTPPPAGSYTWSQQRLTVRGAGAGLNVQGGERGRFVSVSRAAGDFELVARLAEFGGEPDAVAGLMARADTSANGPMVALSLKPRDNQLGWLARSARVESGGIKLVKPAPLWLKLVRLGHCFAVYRSRDGRLWSMISNVSGGAFPLDGPLRLGVFVAGGDTPASAVFDSFYLGAPRLRWRTSWVGNSFGSRPDDNHVSNALSALWVAPDGTCYTSSYWDEGGAPVTSYRDGRVLRGLPIGTPQTAEGGITGDSRYLYVAAAQRLVRLDPNAPDFAPQPLTMTLGLVDKKSNNSIVSGLASTGRELFVADWREDRIRVVSLEPGRSYQQATAANDDSANAPAPVPVPGGDPPVAPALVYQSQRVGEGVRYTVPDLVPGAAYTVRGHFAEYVDRRPDCDPRNRYIVVAGQQVNVAELAGGVLKPLVKDFAGLKADAQGRLILDYGAYGGPGLCGFEVLDETGARRFAMNCGGPPVGEFKGECDELPARAFAFERPGAMAVDRRGELWIIQRGRDHPIGGTTSAKYPAAVRCYRPDGSFTGREFTDVVNPRALGYDAGRDELLVAENGPDLNIRIYAGLATAPKLTRLFGQTGGIYSGQKPGAVYDAVAGGHARFAGVAGVGVDAQGNLYVGGGLQGTDLRRFGRDGKLAWRLHSLAFCNTYDVDPASDGGALYGTYNHLLLDLTKTEPGTEQQYVGYNWDVRRFGEPDRAGAAQAIVRRLGPERRLILYTTGQGVVDDVRWFRYEGELAIPCGATRDHGKSLWVDANGNGQPEPDEITVMPSPIGWITGVVVDSKGDLWCADTATDGSFMRHFRLKGLNAKGVPVYSGLKGDGYEDLRFPEEGGTVNGWGMASRMDYDAERDILIACYPAVARTGESDKSPARYWLARYDRWSQGNRKPTWKQKALRPETDPDWFMYERDLFPYSGYMGLQLAGDYVFFAYLFGEVHVFDAGTGRLAEILTPGPEVNGQNAWEDAAMGLRAYRRKNGEYLVLTENSGWGGKNTLFRWHP